MKRYRITIRGGKTVSKAEITVQSAGWAALEDMAEKMCLALDGTAYVDGLEELA